MTKTFKNLDNDKQKRIINAALKEFSKKDFEQASTNQIVKDAEIGKGMLFYYFNSKKELYFYLINYCLEITEEKYLNVIDMSERDLFKRLKNMAYIKLRFLKNYPDAMDFLGKTYLNSFDHLNEKLKSKIIALQKKSYTQLYGNIDYSLFRVDIDAKKSFDLIRWSFDGYEKEMTHRLRGQDISSIDYDAYWEEFYEYLDIMKTSFYTKEEKK